MMPGELEISLRETRWMWGFESCLLGIHVSAQDCQADQVLKSSEITKTAKKAKDVHGSPCLYALVQQLR